MMANTLYEEIYKLFYDRIQNDEDFFSYINLTSFEAQEIAKERSKSLLLSSIDKLYECGTPDIDFYNKNDTTEIFNIEQKPKEKDLLSHIMFIKYLELDVIKLKVQNDLFSTKDMKIFDPSNSRRTFMDMFNDREDKMEKSIKSYYSRDRETNRYKTINYSTFYN